MTQVASRGAARQKRHDRIRLRLEGDGARPRLAVFRSLKHISAQVIDDTTGRTLAAAASDDLLPFADRMSGSSDDAAASVRPVVSSMTWA